MNRIKDIVGREILDSRGNPTVEVDIILNSGLKATASVPSGASTGIREALELRDKDKDRYLGKGVLKAINNINTIIKDKLIGMDSLNQRLIDETLINLDGTDNKSNLGANAILGVSLANFKVAALYEKKELYEYLGKDYKLPKCMMNILNGGLHAENDLDIQEFMIVPMLDSYSDNLRMGTEIFHTLKKILQEKSLAAGVGDEGGFAPKISKTTEALDLIEEAITKANYILGSDVYLAIDAAASSFYKDGKYYLDKKELTSQEMVDFYQDLVNKYPIISLEDPMAEEDYEGFKEITRVLGNRIMIVGDDLFVTNKKLLQRGINDNLANSILIKLNQIGTVTETIETINLAKNSNYKLVMSHRSGETEDNYISDFSVGLRTDFIKTGSLCRGERISKYNRLLRIEEMLER